ncbi:LysR family transcriptional regulator [Marinobacter halodurans]|uniref:LysR family transcriptional regulator n=1 Tax=Marinobacter halodurans TaxID=2528979 RepID=A0ABY1ZIX6_9GAMM|nr:winged helix-turn-helix domain-containing protein [Marinobacter halodurans]TBW51865.1 LysR family transcriptional regulator [Marinobacter halodurans]
MTRTHHQHPRFQLRLVSGKDVVIGPGKADLLDAIGRTGSISSATREMGLSYKKAWQLINTMNEHFAAPVIATVSGGSQRGGAELTDFGHRVLEQYRALQTRLTAENAPETQALLNLLAPSDAPDP